MGENQEKKNHGKTIRMFLYGRMETEYILLFRVSGLAAQRYFPKSGCQENYSGYLPA